MGSHVQLVHNPVERLAVVHVEMVPSAVGGSQRSLHACAVGCSNKPFCTRVVRPQPIVIAKEDRYRHFSRQLSYRPPCINASVTVSSQDGLQQRVHCKLPGRWLGSDLPQVLCDEPGFVLVPPVVEPPTQQVVHRANAVAEVAHGPEQLPWRYVAVPCGLKQLHLPRPLPLRTTTTTAAAAAIISAFAAGRGWYRS